MSSMKEHCASYRQYEDLRQRAGKDPVVRSFHYGRAQKAEGGDRDLTFVVFTEQIARDGDIIRIDGIDTAAYEQNPVMLWAHARMGRDATPIATAVGMSKSRKRGVGKILSVTDRFLTEDLDQFADKIFRFYQEGVLRAVSGAWVAKPDGVNYLRDEEGYIVGIEFVATDMIEHSGVAVGADPHALISKVRGLGLAEELFAVKREEQEEVLGRPVMYLGEQYARKPAVSIQVPDARQFDVAAESEPVTVVGSWKFADVVQSADPNVEDERGAVAYGAHGSSPVKADRARPWDAAAAVRRVRRKFSSDGSGKKDKIQWRSLRKAYTWYDESNAQSFGAYKLPHHDVIDGKFAVVFRGVAAAAQRVSQGRLNIPAADKPGVRRHLASEYHRWDEKAPWERMPALCDTYERIHEQLRTAADDAEIATLRRTAETIAAELYGAERLREPWESVRVEGAGDPEWAKVADILERTAGDITGDSEEREDHAALVLHELKPVLIPLLTARKLVEELMRLTETDNGEALLGKIKEIIVPQDEVVDVSGLVDTLSDRRRQVDFGKSATNNVLGVLQRILSGKPEPAAGSSG